MFNKTKIKKDYDKENDILFVFSEKGDYDHSVEFDDFVVDFDKKGKIKAIEIFDFSKLLKKRRKVKWKKCY